MVGLCSGAPHRDRLDDMKKVLASKALQLEKLFKEWDEVSLARAATTCT